MISLVGSPEEYRAKVLGMPQVEKRITGTTLLKRGFAHMFKHGVIMDVTKPEEAQIAEDAGAVAVMVLDKLPYDVRKAGGVARTASLKAVDEILKAVTIPVMAKCRIGHTYEARILEEAGVDMIDESEVLTPADEERHIWKWEFTTPFVNGARDLGEALRRIEEGAAMIRTKGEPGTGNVAEAIKHIKVVNTEIAKIRGLYLSGDTQELIKIAREMRASYELVLETAKLGKLPVVNLAAGGIATPADAAMMMQIGCDGIFVGSGIFKSEDPAERARAIVLATTYWDDPKTVSEAQRMIDERKSMMGMDTRQIELKMQERGANL
ncbi:MAG: pyridoxal 5'-phosphate synthase lyase subunit PdxS [Conexivisphaerales archaeon]